MKPVENLKSFGAERGIFMKGQKEIAAEVAASRTRRGRYSLQQIKENFDDLIIEMEKEMYEAYLHYEQEYAKQVIKAFIDHLIENRRPKIDEVGSVVSANYRLFDRFFLSLSQSRKSRAGSAFEEIHNSLFKMLGYPFEEQVLIDGKPDFLMPSEKHYRKNPMDCVIFTAKRTVRERWRQIVTEGTRGLGFYLATIDPKVSSNTLKDMVNNRIYLVVPHNIKKEYYEGAINVISFRQFFQDHLDPWVEGWRRNKVI